MTEGPRRPIAGLAEPNLRGDSSNFERIPQILRGFLKFESNLTAFLSNLRNPLKFLSNMRASQKSERAAGCGFGRLPEPTLLTRAS